MSMTQPGPCRGLRQTDPRLIACFDSDTRAHKVGFSNEVPTRSEVVLYWAFAALNLTTSSAGTRPRSLTSMPWDLAHSRTSEGFGPLLGLLRALPRPARRA